MLKVKIENNKAKNPRFIEKKCYSFFKVHFSFYKINYYNQYITSFSYIYEQIYELSLIWIGSSGNSGLFLEIRKSH